MAHETLKHVGRSSRLAVYRDAKNEHLVERTAAKGPRFGGLKGIMGGGREAGTAITRANSLDRLGLHLNANGVVDVKAAAPTAPRGPSKPQANASKSAATGAAAAIEQSPQAAANSRLMAVVNSAEYDGRERLAHALLAHPNLSAGEIIKCLSLSGRDMRGTKLERQRAATAACAAKTASQTQAISAAEASAAWDRAIATLPGAKPAAPSEPAARSTGGDVWKEAIDLNDPGKVDSHAGISAMWDRAYDSLGLPMSADADVWKQAVTANNPGVSWDAAYAAALPARP